MVDPELLGQVVMPPLELTGNMAADRQAFYKLAQRHVKYQTREEHIRWAVRNLPSAGEGTVAFVTQCVRPEDSADPRKWIFLLEIVVNKGLIDYVGRRLNEDMSDLIPNLVEHDIYEAWLGVKRGLGRQFKQEDRHLLARRRQYLLAKRAGIMDKLFRFHMAVSLSHKYEFQYAMAYANRVVG